MRKFQLMAVLALSLVGLSAGTVSAAGPSACERDCERQYRECQKVCGQPGVYCLIPCEQSLGWCLDDCAAAQ
jgi:hypothetical protein